MFKPTKLKSLVAVAGACVAMFASAPASAYVYALSELRIQNFVLDIQPTAVTTIGQFTFDLTNTASLNGINAASSASCGGSMFANNCGVSPVLDATVVNAPGSTISRAENSFAFLGADNVNTYSNSDSVITTAELVTGTPTALNQVAESLLNINGRARANSEIQSNTGLNVSFSVVGGPATLNLSFLADPDQRAQINGAIGAYLAQSNLNASVTLTNNTTGGVINWTPRGSAFNDCSVSGSTSTCVETFDSANLNRNVSTGTNPSTFDNSYEVADNFERFGILVSNLEAGDYTVALNALTSTSITRAVPEPGSLALIGLAFLGLGFGASRRQNKQG